MGSRSVEFLVEALERRSVKRRDFLRLVSVGTGGIVASGLLAACGGDDDPPQTTESSATDATQQSTTPAADETPAQSSTDSGEPSILRIGHEREVTSNIDPHINQGQPIYVIENLYEPLAYPYLDTGEMTGVLAESYEISADNTIYTFQLRDNVKFHDGTVLDAETVKRSFERIMSIGLAYVQAELNARVRGITTPDDRTIVFDVEPGGIPFIAVQTGVLIASAEAIEEHSTSDDPDGREYFALEAVGTGPYRLEELRPKDTMSITKFDDYWGGWDGPHFTEAVWTQVPEGATQALMLEREELDVSFIVPLQSVPAMASDPRFQVVQERGTYLFYLRMATEGGPLQNKALRQAFAHAFDYEAYDAVREDYLPPEGPVASQFLGGWVPDNLPTYDIERAKQLYAEAGYGPDNPVEVTQAIITGADYQQTAAEIMQQGLEQLGVTYNIMPSQFAPVREGLRRWIATGDESGFVDMFTLRMPANVPDPVAQLYAYPTGADLNLMGYTNPEVDRRIEEALLNPDPEARLEQYKEIVQIIVDDVPDIWLGVEQRTVVMGAAIRGFYQHPLWFPALRVYEMYREG
jgi:peptide/nickel transport system substrate-binding protein